MLVCCQIETLTVRIPLVSEKKTVHTTCCSRGWKCLCLFQMVPCQARGRQETPYHLNIKSVFWQSHSEGICSIPLSALTTWGAEVIRPLLKQLSVLASECFLIQTQLKPHFSFGWTFSSCMKQWWLQIVLATAQRWMQWPTTYTVTSSSFNIQMVCGLRLLKPFI